MMYPVMLELSGGPVVVVGGGAVAERKVGALLRAGPSIIVVAPDVTDGLARLGDAGTATIHRRAFADEDIHGAVLVVAATNDRNVNRRIGELARSASIPVNVADAPTECTVQFPAVHIDHDAGIAVSVSTFGRDPSRARCLRDVIREFLSTFKC